LSIYPKKKTAERGTVDFYQISVKDRKDGPPQIYPDWTVGRSKDLMVRGKSFYAVWDEEKGLWSTDEYDVQRLVDQDLHKYNDAHDNQYQVKSLKSFNTQIWNSFKKFVQVVSDNSHVLDSKLTFANSEVKKTDYASKRLPYALQGGAHDAWDELLNVLYSEEERLKIEWAIGSIVSGESKKIQKFLVFYGPAGSGKSTVLNVIQKLFEGYTVTFDARALGTSNNSFATEAFRTNPLVAIQHDGDLSKIDDNTKLNSIISHEEMTMNEKYKPSYTAKVNAFLFMGTNKPVKISDAKSGIIRRLIDVRPTGAKIEPTRYHALMEMLEFELGAIANHCLETYKAMGKNYYNTYKPLEMMLQTDVFYNYVEYVFDIFKAQNGVTLKQAYELYKDFCSETGLPHVLPQYKFREELRNYFEDFQDRAEIDGVMVRSYYSGFKRLETPNPYVLDDAYEIKFEEGIESSFDRLYVDQPAQYGKQSGYPGKKWANVETTLKDIKTSKLHFVKVPEQHIVIDFDLCDENGEKDLGRNISAASKWPPTYSEISKSGSGVHLHYYYSGAVSDLDAVYDVGIEVKTLLGDSSLRRKLTKCNNLDIVTLTSGLKKKEKPMLESKSIKTEKGLRDLIDRNLRKEIHPGTKPSIDFIHKILDDAYNAGMSYDVRDLRGVILTFAAKSSNQASACIKMVQKMKFVSDDAMKYLADDVDRPLVFFDVEVYPNLFVVCWKYAGKADVVAMINPAPHEIEELFEMKLIGFNNRRYDNHILYARYLGYTNMELYNLSQRIIDGKDSALFGEAYNLSFADIYDFSSKKQGLKKFQIELSIHHMEMDHPWDEPVPDNLIPLVVEYCKNDVVATEAVFISRKQDFVAREILADLSGLSVNHSTLSHTARIIFGEERHPQSKFVYTDLSEEFPGYIFNGKESTYRDEITGEGGYVYSEVGMYENVAVLDVASMHPTSIEKLNLFGPYTNKYVELKEARLAIKHKDFETASGLFGGKLGKFLDGTDESAEALSYALKIVINIVYGLTSARFPNPFKDNRNVDNIVAKRGALFMIDLKHAVQEQGFQVVHIKTDSIKIPDASPEIIEFVTEFGKKYGYDFEHETTYSKFCLVNDAVYIAKNGDTWDAVGAQFQHSYVYKVLFSKEELTFEDFCETKNVSQGVMYLEYDDGTMIHVGRTGSFVPVTYDGGTLWRVKDDKKYAVVGTKGYKWVEREVAFARMDVYEDFIDFSYFEALKNEASDAIDYFGLVDKFTL
jgi:energy-coupling factor transporter ATP-binding protein EcfA2